MNSTRTCPALFIAAPASSEGKTSATAGIARLMSRRGLRVRVFKCGPDFLDPYWHTLASGQPVDNLDLWLNGEDDIRARLYESAAQNDLILIEGVMGLFDGMPSSADLAELFGIPVVAVIDGSAMAGTFGAIAFGLQNYRNNLPWAGVLGNRVAGSGHAKMLQLSILRGTAKPDSEQTLTDLDAGWLGALERSARFELPERHLGLTVATELPDAMLRLDALADALATTPLGAMDAEGLQRWAVDFAEAIAPAIPPLLRGLKIAVARDAAFCFIYPANIGILRALGAEIVFFSPLSDEPVPPSDALWLPGGYPEIHAQTLAQGTRCPAAVKDHIASGKPVWAECGGMMPLFKSLELNDGVSWPMWGVLPGSVRMQKRLAALGPQQWDTRHGALRGHTFHYSVTESPLLPAGSTTPQSEFGRSESIYVQGSVQASYFHAWFASNPEATARLFLTA